MTISKNVALWLGAVASFIIYYVAFGSLTVEGYDTPPLSFRVLDIVSSLFSILLFAGIVSLILALFLFKKERYLNRVGKMLPLAFIGTTALLILVQVNSCSPVRL